MGRVTLPDRKARLRGEMRAAHRSATPAESPLAASDGAGSAAVARLLATAEYRAARSVALYAALPDELATRALFDAARRGDRRCALPRVNEDSELTFTFVADWDDLRIGRYGVLEPAANAATTALADVDLIVVPGVAFDATGSRLGRGCGYYDRALVGARRSDGHRPPVFGWAQDWRVVDEVHTGRDDQPVDAVVTDLRLLRVRKG